VQHGSPDEEATVVRLPRDRHDRAAIDTAERICRDTAQARCGSAANTGDAKPRGTEPHAAGSNRTGSAPVATRCCDAAARDTPGG
jgi:hypothetical protein